MALVPAKCPECGGFVEVYSEKSAGICQHCGQPFVVEKAINTFNSYYNINNITYNNYGDGTVVNVYEDKPKDFIIEGGVLKKYQGASVDVVIPDGIIEIGEKCFDSLKVKTVVIPDSVTSIGASAFYNCTNLESITIPDNVTSIGNRAFCECKSLESVIVGDSISNVGDYAFEGTPFYNNPILWNDDVLYIGKALIVAKESLSGAYTIKDGTKCISANAFAKCKGLRKIVIPESVTKIGSCAFGVIGLRFEEIVAPIDMLPKIKAGFNWEYPYELGKIEAAVRKGNGLCTFCGGTFKDGFFSTKCTKCGKSKDY